MTAFIHLILSLLTARERVPLCDLHHHHYGSYRGPDSISDPHMDAFFLGAFVMILCSAGVLVFCSPFLVVWVRRIRHVFWVIPSVNAALYLLSISLRAYPGGFVARFQPPGLWFTLVEVVLLLLLSLLVASFNAGAIWVIRRLRARKAEPVAGPNAGPAAPPIPVATEEAAFAELNVGLNQDDTFNLANLSKLLGALALVAARAFAGTLLLFMAAGLILGIASYVFLKENTFYACIFAVVAFAEAVAVGIFMGNKRAIISALATGVGKAQLGRWALTLCFDRLLKVSPEESFGARGRRVAVAVERLPLAQAEQCLIGVVNQLVREPVEGSRMTGWFWGLLRRRMLRLVQTYTLAHFRQQGAREGGVDLVKVKAELGPTIDNMLIRRLKRGLNLWTCGLLLALLIVVAVQIHIVLSKFYAH